MRLTPTCQRRPAATQITEALGISAGGSRSLSTGRKPPIPDTTMLGYARGMADFIQVSTATPDRQAAVDLARSVVAERLAAGAQIIGPVTSVFWHNGDFGIGEEWQLLFKTRRELYAEIEDYILRNHP